MAKTRLNNADREVIAKAIIKYKYDPLRAANRRTEYALAAEVYARVYSPEIIRKMKALPDGAFAKSDDIYVSVNGQKHKLEFSADRYDELGQNEGVDGTKRTFKPMFHKHTRQHYGDLPPLLLTDADDLGARIAAWAAERADLRQAPDRQRAKLDAALSQFKYFDDLVSEFPQAEAFILKRWRERPEGGSPGVPAVVIRDLAKELDLPPELAEAA